MFVVSGLAGLWKIDLMALAIMVGMAMAFLVRLYRSQVAADRMLMEKCD